MKDTIEDVLDEYRKGDESKRLSLFLSYRDLRDFFSLIDRESPRNVFSIDFPRSRKDRLARAA